jgi:hypothetical protein
MCKKLVADFWGFGAFFGATGYIPLDLVSFEAWGCLKKRLNHVFYGVEECNLIVQVSLV